jgi:hypothetical protein
LCQIKGWATFSAPFHSLIWSPWTPIRIDPIVCQKVWYRVARLYIFKPKIPILVNFSVSCKERWC